MIETLVGTVVGAVLALSVSLAVNRFEKKSAAKTLARALLAEIEALAKRDQASLEEFVLPLIESWKSAGEVKNADVLAVVFNEDPALRFPLYYSSVSELGLLPSSSSLHLMRYHNLRSGLLSAGKLLCSFDHDSATVKQLGRQIESAVHEMMEAKGQAITALAALADEPQLKSQAMRQVDTASKTDSSS